MSHRGRARGIWRHTSASGKEPRNGCKSCRTAALALCFMVVCWQVLTHVTHGPRAVKKRYTGETGIAINWRDGPVTDPTLKLLEGMQQLQQQQELYKIWAMRVSLVALLFSTAVLIRSLVCKPLSENSDDGIADVEAGMLPTDHAAGGINDAALQFLDVTREDGGRMQNMIRGTCHSECAGGLLKQAEVTNVLKVHNPPQERLVVQRCPRLHAECVCSALCADPGCADLFGSAGSRFVTFLQRDRLAPWHEPQGGGNQSTVRLRRSDL